MDSGEQIKINLVIIGDKNVGKTSILTRHLFMEYLVTSKLRVILFLMCSTIMNSNYHSRVKL